MRVSAPQAMIGVSLLLSAVMMHPSLAALLSLAAQAALSIGAVIVARSRSQ